MPTSEQLITVHVRWGDKKSEMKLVDIDNYITAINTICTEQGLQSNSTYIYLATEDPKAVQLFLNHSNPEWTIYIDQFYKDMLPFRNNITQEVAGVAKHDTRHEGSSHVGILALGSLLVSMEANHYILTSASNWSRLISELRRNIILPRIEIDSSAKNVTKSSVIDLRKSTFWLDLDENGNGV